MLDCVQYVVASEGQRVAVVLTVGDYERLVKDLYVGEESPERHDVNNIPWDQLREMLVAEGLLDITDSEGRKTALYLPLEAFEDLVEELHDGRIVRERKDGPHRPYSEFAEELRSAGEIDV